MRDPLPTHSPLKTSRVRSTIGVDPGAIRNQLLVIRGLVRNEAKKGLSGDSSEWQIISMLLARTIARLTIGRGSNPQKRLEHRASDVLDAACVEMNRRHIDRGIAGLLAGYLLGLLPRNRGRRDARSELDAATDDVPSQHEIQKYARQLRRSFPKLTAKAATTKALLEFGIPDDERYFRIVKRLSDRPK